MLTALDVETRAVLRHLPDWTDVTVKGTVLRVNINFGAQYYSGAQWAIRHRRSHQARQAEAAASNCDRGHWTDTSG